MVSQAVAGTLSLTDLGTLGGSTSTGTAINNHGYAVGSSLTSGGATHAFEYNPNTSSMTDLGVLAGQTSSVANGINDSNVIVGQSGSPGTTAFKDTGSGLVTLGPGDALGINNSGVTIGSTGAVGGNSTAEWSVGDTRTIYFSGQNSQAAAINSSGQFVGTLGTGTVGYFANGTTTSSITDNLGAFLPAAINNNSILAGQDGTFHEAAMYTVSTLTETILGKLSPSDSSSEASGINSAGTIVGTSGTAGFEWTSSGGMVLLTSLLGSGFSGWTIVSASAINDNGQILAEGLNGGVEHAVILSLPTPEPSSFVLLGIAAIGLGLWRPGSAAASLNRRSR
jgi:probable HAF family extracellular repeat protein